MDELRLCSDDLCWRCDPSQFEFASTEELPPLEGIIGQERAMTAIDFGIGIRSRGFNLFVLGQPGTGRTSTIKAHLASHAENQPVPDDWCYVHDLIDGTSPEYIRLPPGKGWELKSDVDNLVERLSRDIPKIFAGRMYEKQRDRISKTYQRKQSELYTALELESKEEGFILQEGSDGPNLSPLKDGKTLTEEEYEKLSPAEKTRLEKKSSALHKRIKEVSLEINRLEMIMQTEIADMEKSMMLIAIDQMYEEMQKKYHDFEHVVAYFEACKEDLLGRIEEFREQRKPQLIIPGMTIQTNEPSFDCYQVNLLVDNSECEGAPVVYETNPTYFNLFGRIEHIIEMGSASTNFHMIKAGALHRANGGYLILDCREVLLSIFSYEALKRCIRNREVKMEDMVEQYRLIATVSLKPQPIPLDCKIVLIGTPILYYLLYEYDPDFRKYFKVKVDFDQMMKNTWENVHQYA
ncbi:MAG: AAA family ATPase, partial [Desulfuromonadales bacterium]|nr:AAA family ATPase [Desulfuromonadales bacterium]